MPVMFGGGMAVKLTPLLSTPAACTTTLPLVAPDGTGTLIVVEFQLVGVPAVPLNLAVLVPCVDPKPVPFTVINAPMAPVVGDTLVITGAAATVKLRPLLFTPLVLTTTLPVVAPAGTVVTMLVALQLATVARVPLNRTVPLPCVAPKFVPAIVTVALIAPEAGDRLEIFGVPSTVKLTPLLFVAATATTTFPVTAPVGTVTTMAVLLQLVTVAVLLLVNFAVLVPWVAPKFVPVIVTDAPTAPEEGDRLEIVGAAVTIDGTNRHSHISTHFEKT